MKKNVVHDRVKELLNNISLDENVKELFKEVLAMLFSQTLYRCKTRIKELKTERESIKTSLDNTEDKYVAEKLTPEEYIKFKNRSCDKIKEFENRTDSLKENNDDLMKFVGNSVELLCKLGNVFNRLQNKEKSSFLRVIYPENPILKKSVFEPILRTV